MDVIVPIATSVCKKEESIAELFWIFDEMTRDFKHNLGVTQFKFYAIPCRSLVTRVRLDGIPTLAHGNEENYGLMDIVDNSLNNANN